MENSRSQTHDRQRGAELSRSQPRVLSLIDSMTVNRIGIFRHRGGPFIKYNMLRLRNLRDLKNPDSNLDSDSASTINDE